MATREEILGKIRSAILNGAENPSLPDPPQVWPVKGDSADEMLAEFEKNLKSAAGESVRCSDRAEAAVRIAEFLKTVPLNTGVKGDEKRFRWGVRNDELTHFLVDAVLPIVPEIDPLVEHAPEDPNAASPSDLESISASLVPAEFLLADTGSAVIRSSSAFNRLLTYLSPVCFVAAKKSLLREHLPHAWPELMERVKGTAEASGEFLLMTGPSRTADIEKILILGVHGPKRVVLFIIENE